MKRIVEFVFKSVKIGGRYGGSYNITTGAISHPPYGSGKKSPKVKSTTKVTKK